MHSSQGLPRRQRAHHAVCLAMPLASALTPLVELDRYYQQLSNRVRMLCHAIIYKRKTQASGNDVKVCAKSPGRLSC